MYSAALPVALSFVRKASWPPPAAGCAPAPAPARSFEKVLPATYASPSASTAIEVPWSWRVPPTYVPYVTVGSMTSCRPRS